jgi:hypothetical protein
MAQHRPETPGGDGRRRISWLMPDAALFLACVTFLYCLFLFDGGHKLFRDSDTGWHIRTGERILASHSLPRADTYSFSFPGRPWFAWEWGSDVLMGAAHRLDGLRGVAVLYMVAIATCTWLWFRLHWVLGGDFLIACLMVVPMLSTANLHWLARPHVFGWLFLLAAMLAIECKNPPLRVQKVAFFAVLSALWCNLHASFIFLPVILLLYSVIPNPWDDAQPRPKFYLEAGAATLASLLNPYGWNLHVHIFQYLTNHELLARVGEFQSFNFHAEGSFQILLTVALAMTGGVLALANRRLDHFLLLALMVGMALRSARALPLVALLMPIANASITNALRRAGGLKPHFRKWLDDALSYTGRLRMLDQGLKGYVVVPLLLAVPFIYGQYGFPADEFPVRAAERLPAEARLLAPDKFGGYLIYRFDGQRKVYFDGRSDYYGTAFMKDYIKLVEVRPGWRQELERFGFTHALLPNRYSLIPALEQLGWKTQYRDELCTLLSRN